MKTGTPAGTTERIEEDQPRIQDADPPETPSESLTDEKTGDPGSWASPEDVGGDRDFQVTTLPALGKKVRILFLSTPEITRLALLPDLIGFSNLAKDLQDEDEKVRQSVDTAKLAVEEKRYQARLAHRSILASEVLDEVPCDECGEEFPHPAPLFTVRQAERLHPSDLQHVTFIAVQASRLGVVRPFSNRQTRRASRKRASSSK